MFNISSFFKIIFVLLLYFINNSESECTNQKTFNFTKIKVCNDVYSVKCIIQEIDRCIGPEGVANNSITSVTIIGKVPIFRRGAIQNLPELQYIRGDSTNVTKLNVGCFLNLPKLISVRFISHNLEEILWGVFNNSTIEDIELSWGLISSIESEAFSNMPNLQVVRLTGNKLDAFDKSWFNNIPNLMMINLGFNKITTIRIRSFDKFPKLECLNLSFNQIKTLEAEILYNIPNLQVLDVVGNELSWIRPDMGFNTTVFEILVSLNKLSFLPIELLENLHIKHFVLHPNPWKCACLDEITKWISKNSGKEFLPLSDFRIKYNFGKPECYVSKTKKCAPGYDSDILEGQKEFFNEVKYTSYIRKNILADGSSVSIDTSAYLNFSRY